MNATDQTFLSQVFDFIIRVFPTRDWTVGVAALVIGALLSAFGQRFWKWLAPLVTRIYQATWKLSRIESAISPNGKGLWLPSAIPPKRTKSYNEYYTNNNASRIPIIVVANLKGGVGKTTTTANLAAHYAIKKKESVLVLDFDYQGSLTSMMLSDDDFKHELEDQSEGNLCKSGQLLSDKGIDWLLNAARPVNNVPGATIIPALYSLANAESRLLVEWLIAARKDDLRYQLAAVLHDARIKNRYQRIIIDAPPRLTTSCVAALSAATHVLIPTVLDKLSTEAVGTFADQIRVHEEIWPHLKIVGILGTMTERMTAGVDGSEVKNPLNRSETDALVAVAGTLEAALADARATLRAASVLPVKCFTPDKTALARSAGRNVAYAVRSNADGYPEVRAAYDRLGDEIDSRILGNPTPAQTQ